MASPTATSGPIFARHDKLKTLRRLVRRLHDLGYEVELKQVA
jgi:hypothetical protein